MKSPVPRQVYPFTTQLDPILKGEVFISDLEEMILNCKTPHTGEWTMGCERCTDNTLVIGQMWEYARLRKNLQKVLV